MAVHGQPGGDARGDARFMHLAPPWYNRLWGYAVRGENRVRCQCGGASKVIDSRPRAGRVCRRRRCKSCGRRWSTVELDPAAFIAGLRTARRRAKALERMLAGLLAGR